MHSPWKWHHRVLQLVITAQVGYILLLLFKRAVIAPNKLIVSQYYKLYIRETMKEFHSLWQPRRKIHHLKFFKFLQNDNSSGRSAFQTNDQPGPFKYARVRCKTCPLIRNVEKISGPKWSIKIPDHFTLHTLHNLLSWAPITPLRSCGSHVLYLLTHLA